MLEFTVTVSEADYYSANAKVHFESWTPVQVLLALVCSSAIFASAALVGMSRVVRENEINHLEALIIGVGIGALMLSFRYVSCWMQLPSSSNKLYAQTGTLAMATHYQLTQERFRTSYEEGTDDHPWSRFCDYIDAGDVLVLRRTPGFTHLIPMHQLSAQQREDLIALLTQVGVKRR